MLGDGADHEDRAHLRHGPGIDRINAQGQCARITDGCRGRCLRPGCRYLILDRVQPADSPGWGCMSMIPVDGLKFVIVPCAGCDNIE